MENEEGDNEGKWSGERVTREEAREEGTKRSSEGKKSVTLER